MYQRIHVVFPDGAEATARIDDGMHWSIEPDSYTPQDSSRKPGELAERKQELDDALEFYGPRMIFDVHGAGGIPPAYNVGPLLEIHWPGTKTLETVPPQVESVPGRVY